MKLLSRKNVIELDIVAVLDSANSDMLVADTSVTISHRKLKKKHQLTEDQLTEYKDFVTSVVQTIINNGFDITSKRQSPMSYSYYVCFETHTDDTLLKVKFRLSDHTSKDITDNLSSKEPGVFSLFRSFIVKGVEHENVLEVLKTVNKVCENIKKGKV